MVAYGILVSPQSQMDFGFFTSLGLGLGLGLGGQGLGLGFDNFLSLFKKFGSTQKSLLNIRKSLQFAFIKSISAFK